jgi:hypothetical protein
MVGVRGRGVGRQDDHDQHDCGHRAHDRAEAGPGLAERRIERGTQAVSDPDLQKLRQLDQEIAQVDGRLAGRPLPWSIPLEQRRALQDRLDELNREREALLTRVFRSH